MQSFDLDESQNQEVQLIMVSLNITISDKIFNSTHQISQNKPQQTWKLPQLQLLKQTSYEGEANLMLKVLGQISISFTCTFHCWNALGMILTIYIHYSRRSRCHLSINVSDIYFMLCCSFLFISLGRLQSSKTNQRCDRRL